MTDNIQTIHAHKYVLATGSSVFYAMFFGGLAENKKEIKVPDVEPAAFLALLKWVSICSYSCGGSVCVCLNWLNDMHRAFRFGAFNCLTLSRSQHWRITFARNCIFVRKPLTGKIARIHACSNFLFRYQSNWNEYSKCSHDTFNFVFISKTFTKINTKQKLLFWSAIECMIATCNSPFRLP